MFKATNMGAVEGVRGFALTGMSGLRRFLIGQPDTVQLAAVSGMPTCGVTVSEDARRAPAGACAEGLIQAALGLLTGVPNFYHTRITQYIKLYLLHLHQGGAFRAARLLPRLP